MYVGIDREDESARHAFKKIPAEEGEGSVAQVETNIKVPLTVDSKVDIIATFRMEIHH